MARKKLLTSRKAFKRTDSCWAAIKKLVEKFLSVCYNEAIRNRKGEKRFCCYPFAAFHEEDGPANTQDLN